MKEKNEMIGFCFSGEGARGAVQAGIALALSRRGIKADFAIGISSGSCCAAAYAYGGPQGLYEMWSEIRNLFSVFYPNWNFLWKRGVFNQKPAEKKIAKLMNKQPICEGVVSRLNIITGELQYVSSKSVSSEEFFEAALGACAITGLVEDRDGWVDAGSRQMVPLKQCIDAGCTEIYVILGRPFDELVEWNLPRGFLSAIRMGYRAIDLSLHELLIRDIKGYLKENGRIPVHIVEPEKMLYESVEFRKCQKGLEYGLTNWSILEYQALRAMF